MPEPQELSFELDEEMLQQIKEEFKHEDLVNAYVKFVEGRTEEEVNEDSAVFFEDYGKKLMQRSLQLGEEYSDRTYEVLRAAADRTGTYRFGLMPQRFLEIAYLSTHDLLTLLVVECTPHRLSFKLDSCPTYALIAKKCGAERAARLFCRNACEAAIRHVHERFNFDVQVTMPAETPRDGYCQFTIKRV